MPSAVPTFVVHAGAASTTCGCSLHYMRVQPTQRYAAHRAHGAQHPVDALRGEGEGALALEARRLEGRVHGARHRLAREACVLCEQQRGTLAAQPADVERVQDRRLEPAAPGRAQRRLHLLAVHPAKVHRRAGHDATPSDERRGMVAVLAHPDEPRLRDVELGIGYRVRVRVRVRVRYADGAHRRLIGR
jgi:hypothetical protein